MTFKKYNSSNNAICSLLLPISNSSMTMIATGNYNRFSIENFIVKVTYYTDGVLSGRENMLITSRSGATFVIGNRAYEPVPINDNASNNIQQALSFPIGAIIEEVSSSEFMQDIQNEVERLETAKLDKSIYNLEKEVFSASVEGNDSYKITSSTVITYNNGQTFKVQADVGNDGACTLELNSLGSKYIKKYVDGALSNLITGDIIAGQIFWATYNQTLDIFQFSVDPGKAPVVQVKSTQSTFVAGENITAGNALRKGRGEYVSSSSNISQLNSSTGGVNENLVRYNATYYNVGQSIILPQRSKINSIILKLQKIGSPTGNLSIDIFSDTSGTLVGTSSTISESTISGSATDYTFTFSSLNLNAGTYYFRLSSDRSPSTSNYIIRYTYNGGNGSAYTINSSGTWISYSGHTSYYNLSIGILSTEDTTKVFKTTASDSTQIKCSGFASETITAGNNIKIDTTGVNSNQTSLITDATYYLGDTAGTISTSAGTNSVKIGRAISSTELLIIYPPL